MEIRLLLTRKTGSRQVFRRRRRTNSDSIAAKITIRSENGLHDARRDCALFKKGADGARSPFQLLWRLGRSLLRHSLNLLRERIRLDKCFIGRSEEYKPRRYR